MDNTTIPTHEMIKNLTEFVVDGMTLPELKQFVYDDIYSIMLEDREMFYVNLPPECEPEDFAKETD